MKKILFIVLLSFAFNSNAQWQPTSLDSSEIDALAVSDTNIFAGARMNTNLTNDGVFLSSNNGISWTAINNGLTNTNVLSLAVKYDTVFAGTNLGGVFISTNNGGNWSAVNTGLPANTIVYALAISGSEIFAGTNSGIYLSTNNGGNWNAINTGIPTNVDVGALAVKRDTIFAGILDNGVCVYGVYLSTNNGSNWSATSLSGIAPAGRNITSLVLKKDTIFAAAWQWWVYLSTNNGNSWSSVHTGLPSTLTTSLALNDNEVFVGSLNGVYLSINNGQHWYPWNTGLSGLPDTGILTLAIKGNYIFAGADSGGVWRRLLSDIILGTKEMNNDESKISVYPNPAINNLTVEAPQQATIEISNIQGQLIETLASTGNKTTIDVSALAKGMYFIKVKTEKGVTVKKFIKE